MTIFTYRNTKTLRDIVRIIFFILLLFSILIFSTQFSFSSAGYYPVKKGEKLEVEVCVPRSIKSPINFVVSKDLKNWKTIKVINFKNLTRGQCESGSFELKYLWKVNVEGEWILHFFDPKSKKTYYPWPDGIVSGKN